MPKLRLCLIGIEHFGPLRKCFHWRRCHCFSRFSHFSSAFSPLLCLLCLHARFGGAVGGWVVGWLGWLGGGSVGGQAPAPAPALPLFYAKGHERG